MGLLSFFERYRNGSVFYTRSDIGGGKLLMSDISDKLEVATTNPVLMPAIQLIASYFASAKFYEVDGGGKLVRDSKILQLLNRPNPLQNADDFLKQFIWYKYAAGFNYIYPVASGANKQNVNNVEYFYNLKPDLIEFGDEFLNGFIRSNADLSRFNNQTIIYDKKKQNLKLKVGDLLPFYDLANGLCENPIISPSRIDALKMQISNINRALDAKNIVIQTNGKEMITNETVGNVAKIPLNPTEKEDVKRLLDARTGEYGLGKGKSRTIITNSALKYQSLHIPLKDLGLDESVMNDAQAIINAFNIPPELFSLNGTSATFENQEKAVIHFLQSKIQVELDDFTDTFNDVYKTKLVARLDHLPIMRSNEKAKIASLRSLAFGLKILVEAGILSIPEAKEEYLTMKDVI